MRQPGRPSHATLANEAAIRAVEELRDKMAAELLAAQHRLEGVEMALKILKEPPF